MMPLQTLAAERCDVLLVGAGLANGLIALALRRARPELRLIVLEPEREPVEHTWSCFETDLATDLGRELWARFDHHWPRYQVRFPRYSRTLDTAYASLTSATLRRWLEEALGPDLRIGRAVTVRLDGADCEDGRRFEAPLVIDGRGAAASPNLRCAFQKFVGVELRLAEPHGLAHPVLMDATVDQLDGYRFLYLLPTSERTVMLEDTRYSRGPALDRPAIEQQLVDLARARSWRVETVLRREQGALPILLDGDAERYWAEPGREAPQSGMRGLFFHPATGYSLPDALQVADLVARAPELASPSVAELLRARSRRLWRRRGFYRMLNRMLFEAGAPEARYRVLERFYRLPQPLIERFYSARPQAADVLRILAGRPPVPIWGALRAAARRSPPIAEGRP